VFGRYERQTELWGMFGRYERQTELWGVFGSKPLRGFIVMKGYRLRWARLS
jgi:hypothetical protein